MAGWETDMDQKHTQQAAPDHIAGNLEMVAGQAADVQGEPKSFLQQWTDVINHDTAAAQSVPKP